MEIKLKKILESNEFKIPNKFGDIKINVTEKENLNNLIKISQGKNSIIIDNNLLDSFIKLLKSNF
jgi:hypothetical protein